MKEKAGIHAGHRKRLRERARKDNLQSFQPHEVLELLLMQVIPQRDVNPTEHLLIDRFGTVSATLQASEEELMQVKGIGLRSAQWLRAMGEMATAYAECRRIPGITVTNSGQAVAYIESHTPRPNGAYVLVCLERAGRALKDIDLPLGKDGRPVVREMVRMALLHHATQVFSVRYADEGGVEPEDREFLIEASELFRLVEIMHLDHFVRTNEGFYSARRTGEIKRIKVPDMMAAEKK